MLLKIALLTISTVALTAAGLPLLKTPTLYSDAAPELIQISDLPLPAPKTVSGKPVRLAVPRLGLDLAVVDGVYNPQSKTWSLGKTTAQFAVTTPLANDTAGNTFIYGHNTAAVFRPLMQLRQDDEVVLTTDNGLKFYYRYRTSFDVQPHEVSAIKHQGQPMLTVQTCVGQDWEHRRMFQFDFIRVET